ncbi:MAG: hypothetical protein LBV47_01825 [Bacteroidales bacterium]|jgi:hypothetical protein|nr:hypothetical protein [Bacteroidales bacterium]
MDGQAVFVLQVMNNVVAVLETVLDLQAVRPTVALNIPAGGIWVYLPCSMPAKAVYYTERCNLV